MSDIDIFDDDDEPEVKRESKEQVAFAQMRKEKKALEKELQELRSFKEQQEKAAREAAVKSALEQAGVDMRQVQFYEELRVAENPLEALETLKSKYFETGDEGTPPPEVTTGFTPTVIADGQVMGTTTYTSAELAALYQENPNKVRQLFQSGRLKTAQE